MSHPSLLPPELQLAAITVLGSFLVWIVRLIRSQRLSLRESLTWLLTTILAIAVTASPHLLVALTAAFGIQVPANGIFAFGLLYLAVNLLVVTVSSSKDAARVRRLAQECALLRAEVAALRAAKPPPEDPAREVAR